MQPLFCWRCQIDVPMLDENEYAIVLDLYRNCAKAPREFREKHGLPLENCSMKERMQPVLDEYRRLTGFDAQVANAVMHHRIALYGPPSEACSKPLRTSKAAFCAACGHVVA